MGVVLAGVQNFGTAPSLAPVSEVTRNASGSADCSAIDSSEPQAIEFLRTQGRFADHQAFSKPPRELCRSGRVSSSGTCDDQPGREESLCRGQGARNAGLGWRVAVDLPQCINGTNPSVLRRPWRNSVQYNATEASGARSWPQLVEISLLGRRYAVRVGRRHQVRLKIMGRGVARSLMQVTSSFIFLACMRSGSAVPQGFAL